MGFFNINIKELNKISENNNAALLLNENNIKFENGK
jgi:hypothetical protein